MNKNQILPYSFTRTAYCEKCTNHFRPKTRDLFVIFPTQWDYQEDLPQARIFRSPRIIDPSRFGFTPHLFMASTILTDPKYGEYRNHFENLKIIFHCTCLMNGCGINLIESTTIANCFSECEIKSDQWREVVLTPQESIALFNFKDNGYEMSYHK